MSEREKGNELEKRKSSRIGVLDTAIVAASVIGGVLVLLWVLKAVAGLVLFAFKLAVVAVVLVVIVRIVRAFGRHDR
jgi:hypothetical protein